ncbi:tetratricopeptide repeat protein [Lyngbya sp. CCY1209]|uniref:O-linked N-acetylglucosamine transferase, SPINDLY family protein n=1 Tax=Lyngbya sp. CCY1209 TaxID=2886103 RepID=UPI002D210EC3|nr:tetratricopeptide repeat protein [Lyngbya sp. CCY1209]MEB3886065.1 tetratricopeptide repeat protein [Lyngbya sp. CCY1209]
MPSQSSSAPNAQSNTPAALLQRAEAFYAREQYDEAIAVCRQALQLQPDSAPVYVTMGNVAQARTQLDEAVRCYAKALELDPNFARAHANLGSMLYKQGKLEEAIASYQKALSLKPDLAPIYVNLARVLRQLGREADAREVERQASVLKSQMGDATQLFHRGNQWAAAGQLPEAIASWQQAIAADPNLAEAYSQIGMIYRHQGKPKEAIPFLEKALELKPDLVAAHQHLCGIYRDSADLAAARRAVDRYVQTCGDADPIMASIYAVSIYQVSGLNRIALDRFLELEAKLPALLPNSNEIETKSLYANLLFALPYLRDNLEQNYALQRLIGDRYISQILTPPAPTPAPSKPGAKGFGSGTGKNPLKIGILSKHFCRHSVGWCSADVIKELAALNTEIYLYWSDRPTRDSQTPQFEQVARNVFEPKNFPQGLPHAGEIAAAIRNDGIDILLDLDSLSVQIHTEILYQKPAPVCISWLGFDAPQLSSQNYFIGDKHTHPEGRDADSVEQLIRMPKTFMAVSGFQRVEADAAQLRQAYRISSDQVVYLCVAPGRKFNRELVDAQVAILKQVPDSILVHKGQGDAQVVRQAYREACQAMGVGVHRIKQINRFATEEEHRKIYLLADVLLDSYPYNGGTHNLEALWFDVPIVTRRGEQFLSRMGYAFLEGVGIDAGVADSWEEYQSWGIQLGLDAELRQSIRDRLAASKNAENLAPLWNPKAFAKDLSAQFEALHKR